MSKAKGSFPGVYWASFGPSILGHPVAGGSKFTHSELVLRKRDAGENPRPVCISVVETRGFEP